ncbi:MAG: undecaprenyl-phosphate glucose phosphotransferase [Armatimonadetes bacterium CG2_30_59_28]|nr:undecaprenyl-phosphate glucose phosphotransferase [Armatimonadota bacterium]OIO99107.1 MAG: undecaprenyl-phosphate glucose phosphotransferase [Armatimonadetes bacterium CG2_30_59_28]PIU66540.1 MAG: undecaprenyl-phosphate glucose phosphotransferase [Armatimonadetes bacterium CG07_land_8_20_14_0_80_59_28]PIX42116.1 MAG: undecaprenyl-phosphate glucose phosphotransferase [Armatimonadetes bacterium CG_4_8_14_3_um_filter_58_9]PJB78853.1 MAG: undecaprenyl-phosphate glucose phosphotransferase [Armat
MTRSDRLFITSLVSADVVCTCVSFVAAHWARFMSGWFPAPLGHPRLDQVLASLILISAIWLLAFKWCGLYEIRRRISGPNEFYAVLLGVGLAAFLFICLAFLAKLTWFSRSVLAIAIGIDVVVVTFSRYALRTLQASMWKRGFGQRRVAIIGEGAEARSLADLISSCHVGYRFHGFLMPSPEPASSNTGASTQCAPDSFVAPRETLGSTDDLPRLALEQDVRDVILLPDVLETQQTLDLVSLCASLQVNVKLMPNVLDIMKRRGEEEDFDGVPLINVSEVPLRGWNRLAKRGIDIFASFWALVLLAPLFVVIALLVKMSSHGRVLFAQERVGERGKTFSMYKFRTMRDGSGNLATTTHTSRDDPRRTWVGTLLRRFSLDELPQLINVLRGEMSLVGPRPEMLEFVRKFQKEVPRYRDRHRIRVGITGWAQVHGLRGDDTSIEERVQHDIYYVENWSLLLDLKIIIKTAFEVLFHRNAY